MEMVDITIHIDEAINHERRTKIVEAVRAYKGVMGVAHRDETPHLIMIQYNPDAVTSEELFEFVLGQGVHAELIGL